MIKDFYEKFSKVEIDKSSDGVGGFEIIANEILSFDAGLTTSSTKNINLGEQYSALNTYSLLFPKEIVLELGDVIRKVETNKYYEVINDPSDFKTPKNSSLNLKKAIVTRYILPKEVN